MRDTDTVALFKDGKNIGTVTDTANGGEIDLYLNTIQEEDELRDYVNSLPSIKFDDMEIPQSPDMFIGNLVGEFLDNKRYHFAPIGYRKSKRGSCFVLRNHQIEKRLKSSTKILSENV